MKILVVGSGGREHALCWKISQSPLVQQLFCAPGNAGISGVATCLDISISDIEGLLDFAKSASVDLTVVGPELPLSLGIADIFSNAGLRIFGPSKKASEIESSKVFSKELMKKYGIPTADYRTFDSFNNALKYLETAAMPVVVKADGLAGGKGVFICEYRESAVKALKNIMENRAFGSSGSRVVVEEYLKGEEASFFVITDGKKYIPLETSQDHKAVYDGDRGPNTGGMGAYSPAPIISDPAVREKILREIVEPTIEAMRTEGRTYSGVLYTGLMITDKGIKVLEYNCRFGDPEAQPILVRMESDIVPVLTSVAEGNMGDTSLSWKDGASVCVIMASRGYPGEYEKGAEIPNTDKLEKISDIFLFHSGTKYVNNTLVSDGGRVLGVTSFAPTIRQARDAAYHGVEILKDSGLYYRKDIASKALND